jgi:hypothetical protein
MVFANKNDNVVIAPNNKIPDNPHPQHNGTETTIIEIDGAQVETNCRINAFWNTQYEAWYIEFSFSPSPYEAYFEKLGIPIFPFSVEGNTVNNLYKIYKQNSSYQYKQNDYNTEIPLVFGENMYILLCTWGDLQINF